MFILFFAFSLKFDLKIKIQLLSTAPLPTLPLNWWSWDKPYLFAFSITITLALGKSIPTSITVVDTRTSIFLFKKRSKTSFFFSFSNDPWINPILSLKYFFKNLLFSTADWWSNFVDFSISGHTQKIWFPSDISFLQNLITSSIFVSNLLYVLISFLFFGFSLISVTSISP